MLRSAAVILAFCACAKAAESFSGLVVGVTDGDTIKVMRKGSPVSVRLDGIDCLEKSQPFGTSAKQFTADLAFDETVTVVEKGTDRYRRIIAVVVLRDGRVLNEELLRAGLAWVFVKYCRDERYYKLEVEARNRRAGLWADTEAVAPGTGGN